MAFSRLVWGGVFLTFLCLAGASSGSIPSKGNLPERLRSYLEADPAGRPALFLEDADGLVPLTVTFFSEPGAVAVSGMEDAGVRFYYCSGGILHYNLRYPVRCDEGGLRRLDAALNVKSVCVPPMQKPVAMLDWTRVDIGAEPSWYHHPETWPLTGEGITIADIDSDIELFHPTFYRPDGGYYAWLDMDGDDTFTPGTDAVDLSGDGEITDDEIIRLVDAAAWRIYAWPPETLPGAGYDGLFTAGLDWLYLDVNHNGRRDFGYRPDDPDFPVTEDTPAYGEPLFIADDFNHNGALDPAEKLIRLGTCKLKAVLKGPGINEYIRGENLVEYPGAASNRDMSHATQALGIVGGGVPGLTRFTGIAPGAELVLASYSNLDYMVCLIWALEQSADIVLHEAGSWVDVFLDGSSYEEQTMDESTLEQGVIHINPSGNLGGSNKHAKVEVPAGETSQIGLVIPDWGGYYAFYWTMMSYLWRQPAVDLRLEMCSPGDVCDDFTDAGPRGMNIWDDTLFVQTHDYVSPRDTRKISAFMGDSLRIDRLPVGTWHLRITNPSEEDATVHVFITDDLMDWTYGVTAEEQDATDLYTVTHPGTADTSLNVAAYAGHGEDWGDPIRRGSYRWYSSQGPRIDEVMNLDVTAPDNPITSAPPMFDGMSWASYLEFGGTSGAGPHVAGGVGLILQADPSLAGELMRDAVRAGALVDVVVGEVPNNQWGWGKFRVGLTIFGEEIPENQPPTLSLRAPDEAFAGEPATLTPQASDPDGDESALRIRWDIGYDGTWDTDWIEVGSCDHVFEEAGQAEVKAMVRDERGLTAQAAVDFEVTLPAEEGPDVPDIPGDGVIEFVPELLEPSPDAGAVEVKGGACGCRMAL